MIQKLSEHSNIKTIFFVEGEPNPAGLFPGNWWVMSWDGNGECVEDAEGNLVGNAKFDWLDKAKAEEYLKELMDICPQAKVEFLYPKDKLSSFLGLLGGRKN